MRSLSVNIFIIVILLVSQRALPAFAQEVLTRKDSFSTEVFLRIPPEQIADIQQNGLTVTVLFRQQMRTPFAQQMDDPFIVAIRGEGNRFTITFQNAADFAAVSTPEGVRFIATRPRELDNVLLSYNLEAPLLRKDNFFSDDPVQDAKLREYDRLMQNNQFYQAVTEMTNLLATTNNNFYRQEALFRLADAQMAIGPTDTLSYLDAASSYDKFIQDFPDSNKVMQARQLSAEAKEKGGSLFEAVTAYRAVYDNTADAETKRQILLKIADLYKQIGQYDNAIKAYEEYLDNFTTDQESIKTILGSLYIERSRQEDAYKMFSQVPVETLTKTLSDAEILALAKIFQNMGDTDKALALFDHLGSSEIAEAPEALKYMADIYKALDQTDNYTGTLKKLMDNFPGSQYGLDALIEYAELNYGMHTAAEWRSLLNPVYQIEDTEGLVPRAEMVQIKALQKANDVFPLVSKIDSYIATYPEESTNAMLLQMKEDALFGKAVDDFTNGQDDDALTIFRQLLAQFPDSPRVPAITQYIDDIFYNRAVALFNSGDYIGTLAAVENQMLDSTTSLAERWPLLWEDAKYQSIMTGVGVLPPWKLRYTAREYLAYEPNGRYVNDITGVLVQNFQIPYNEAFSIGDDVDVVHLYDESRPWLEQWPDQTLANRAKITVTQSLVRMGLRDRAEEMYKSITPMMTIEYAELGYKLCQKNVIYNINNLMADQFSSVVDEAERCGDPDYTLSLVNKYTADMKTALSVKYKVAKNITDDKKREQVLTDIYNKINSDSANQFTGYEEVYLDMGLLAYKKNDFAGTLMPLQKYADIAPNDSEKKAEALYYLGKSLMGMNEQERGLAYFRQVATMPDSVYKNMANNELEDAAWKNPTN